MSSSAVVGIGAGVGALFLCAACFIVFQIYKRKREHNREIAEIEQGFPPAQPVEVSQLRQGNGTVSDPNKPNSTNTFASAPGPAPTGPLPPLPPLPRNISRQSDYNPANRHSALGIPSTKYNDSTSTSLNSTPERSWERIVSPENTNLIPKFKSIQKSPPLDDTAAESGAELSSNGGNSRPASYIGHRRSLVCLSITSTGSNRNSVSSIASTLEKQSNRLSIPQILNADRISISRVSSLGSLSSGAGGVTMVSTPRRHTGSSRVSATGSPSEKPKPNILRAVSGNAGSPQRPMKSALRDSSAEAMSKWEKSVIGPKHSILKGSPSARKGAKSAQSREASLFSIPSLPELSHVGQDEEVRPGPETPAIEFTRPSTEWPEHERSPPFGLHVTPSNSKRSVYNPASSPRLPSWSKYDPSWPTLITNPSASGQEYDPNRPISVYSSDEEDSSSPNFPFALKDEPAPTTRSPPSFLADYDEEKENGSLKSPQSEKEIESPCARAAALTERIRSPFESMPVLRPHASFMEDLDPSLPSPPASPTSSISKTPPLLCRTVSNASDTFPSAKIPNPTSSTRRQNRRSSSTSPRRRSGSSSPHRRSGGIEKYSSRSKRITGPRAQPPKDIRKSIMALRRMNSSLQVSEDELSKGSHRYLHLGREASLELPFDFGFSSEVSDNEEDDPPKDILFEQEENEQVEEKSRECHYITYSPTKPVLSLLTTLPEATRNRLSVWDDGEGYWADQERRVTEAITSSPVDTPTNALDRMLGWEAKEENDANYSPRILNSLEVGKEGLQVLHEGEETTIWDRRKSKAMETPKSARSLYDQQGFYRTP
ncbi:hypothetical protein KCU77_g8209, partial [Aureobasidium melanogenum]